MSRQDWFEWNGVRSTSYGLYVSEQPEIIMPLERTSQITIPGRPGTLTKLEGEDVYGDILMTAQCVMKDASRIPEIMRWLKGAGKVTFANRPGGFYHARLSNQIPFEKVMRGRENRNAAIVFRCKPFWYVANESDRDFTTPGSTLYNAGSVYAEPIITLNGSGPIDLMIGNSIVTIDDLNGQSITLDCENQEAFFAGRDMNSYVNGEFPRLEVGYNTIAWTGNVGSVTIRPNTRYL